MALSIIENIDQVSWSLNPIYAKVHTTTNLQTVGLQVKAELYAESSHGSGIYNIIYTHSLFPDSGGNMVFHFRRILHDYLSAKGYPLPDFNLSEITETGKPIVRFYLKFTEYPNPGAPYPQSNQIRYALMGGIDFENYPTAWWFETEMNVRKPFFTWQPDNKITRPDMQEYLYFFVPFLDWSLNVTSIKLKARIYYDDGTDVVGIIKTKTGVGQGKFYVVPASVEQLGLDGITPGKVIKKYKLWMVDQGDNVISEERTYRINKLDSLVKRIFIFNTSLGGFDTLETSGNTEQIIEHELSISGINNPHNYKVTDGMAKVYDKSESVGIKAATGYYYSYSEIDYFREMLNAREVYEVKNGRFLPVILRKKTIKYPQGDDTLFAAEFEYDYNFRNSVYTGRVLNNEAPPAPGGGGGGA